MSQLKYDTYKESQETKLNQNWIIMQIGISKGWSISAEICSIKFLKLKSETFIGPGNITISTENTHWVDLPAEFISLANIIENK